MAAGSVGTPKSIPPTSQRSRHSIARRGGRDLGPPRHPRPLLDCGARPAFAQAPPPVPALPDSERCLIASAGPATVSVRRHAVAA
jgi:hypothetical protein